MEIVKYTLRFDYPNFGQKKLGILIDAHAAKVSAEAVEDVQETSRLRARRIDELESQLVSTVAICDFKVAELQQSIKREQETMSVQSENVRRLGEENGALRREIQDKNKEVAWANGRLKALNERVHELQQEVNADNDLIDALNVEGESIPELTEALEAERRKVAELEKENARLHNSSGLGDSLSVKALGALEKSEEERDKLKAENARLKQLIETAITAHDEGDASAYGMKVILEQITESADEKDAPFEAPYDRPRVTIPVKINKCSVPKTLDLTEVFGVDDEKADLREENARLREALQFYGDLSTYKQKWNGSDDEEWESAWQRDRFGNKAREALSPSQGEQE